MKKINNKGFTLIEVLAVIVIIAVLGMIAVPSVLNTINKGKDTSYDILIDDVKIASQQLFEELEYTSNGNLYHYSVTEGKLDTNIQIRTKDTNGNDLDIDGNENTKESQITVNFQTLVSNGFLTGINKEEGENSNPNSKIILSPKNSENIGSCEIIITKIVDKSNNYKTSYNIKGLSTNENCPTTEEYQS